MEPVVAEFIYNIKGDEEETCQANGQSEYIEDHISALPSHIPESTCNEIFHGRNSRFIKLRFLYKDMIKN